MRFWPDLSFSEFVLDDPFILHDPVERLSAAPSDMKDA
jgi:hypothetical protein